MVRQVSKELCGLDAVVDATGTGYEHIRVISERELDRVGGGRFGIPASAEDAVEAVAGGEA
jgi:hypothetical protein